MNILFCRDPLNPKQADIDYSIEYEVCKGLGFSVGLMDLESLLSGNVKSCLKSLPENDSRVNSLYRGWMITPNQYQLLSGGLEQRNFQLVNSPSAYKHCHYLPESYPIIQDYTPLTGWLSKEDLQPDHIKQITDRFGTSPILIKDFVKSRKHEWLEACYIPDASNFDHVLKVTGKFLELQGDNINEGIVFREFMELEYLTDHSKSKMPLSKEFRIFFFRGQPIYYVNYWDEGDYDEVLSNTEIEHLIHVGKRVNSSFFTMDIAKTVDGKWIIIELGDGQVSGLPDHADIELFYSNIKKAAQEHSLW